MPATKNRSIDRTKVAPRRGGDFYRDTLVGSASKVLAFIFFTAVVGCATSVEYFDVLANVEALVLDTKFDEARRLTAKYSQVPKEQWTLAGRRGNKKDFATEIVDSINQAQICHGLLSKCDRQATDINRIELTSCIENLGKECNPHGKIPLKLRINMMPQAVALSRRLSLMISDTSPSSASYAPVDTTKSAAEIAQSQNACRLGMRWRYKRLASQDSHPDYGTLMNASTPSTPFASKMACDEARLNDQLRHTRLGDRCEAEYEGNERTATIFKAPVMLKGNFGEMRREDLLFSSMDDCRKAQNAPSNLKRANALQPAVIHPIKSNELPKFIAECTAERIVICRPGSDQILEPAFIQLAH